MSAKIIKRFFLTYGYFPVCSGLFILLICVFPSQAHASMKLKAEHITNKMTCRDCHHDYQKGYVPPPGVKLSTRACSLCHMHGANKITKFEDLPKITKILHFRCIKCHESFLLRGNNEKIRAILEMRSAATKGDVSTSGASQGTKPVSKCLICH